LQISARAVNQHLGVDAQSVWGLCLPWWHVGGFGVLARAFQAQCGYALYTEKWQALGAVAWLRDKRVTHVSMVPTQLHDIVQARCLAPPSLRELVIGGGKMAADLAARARELGWPVRASYGMTEAGSQIATELPMSGSDDLRILPCWRVRTTAAGGIEIAGEALFHGQWHRENDQWHYQARSGEWYATQDMGQTDGVTLRMMHRSDSLVKVLGELVNPLAIEEALVTEGLPMGRVVILAVPDERRQHDLWLIHENLDVAQVQRVVDAYHRQCAGFAKLQRVISVPNFPRSDLGKILRPRLQAEVVGS
jgi:O-succinylbenzoic acid--CoA ligase